VQEPLRHNTLRRLAGSAPADFQWFIGAWRWITLEPLDEKRTPPLEFPKRDFGRFQPTEANRAAWREVEAQAKAAGARGILFKSPAAFTPSAAHIENLRAFRRDVIGDVPYELVWEPRGIWAREELDALAAELGLTIAVDPHTDVAMPEPVSGNAYYVITAPAGRLRFSEDDLVDLHEFAMAHDGLVRLVFRGPEREAHARAYARAFGSAN